MADGVSFTGGGEKDVDMGRNFQTQPTAPSGGGGGPVDFPAGEMDITNHGTGPASPTGRPETGGGGGVDFTDPGSLGM